MVPKLELLPRLFFISISRPVMDIVSMQPGKNGEFLLDDSIISSTVENIVIKHLLSVICYPAP